MFPAERDGAQPRVLSRDGRRGERLMQAGPLSPCGQGPGSLVTQAGLQAPVVRGIPSTDLSIFFRGARCNGIGLRSSFCPGHY